MAEHRPAKILVIGSKGYARVKCVEWFAEPVPNAADFDDVVINAIALAEILREKKGEGKQGKPLSLIEEWRSWLGKLQERLRKLVKTGGRIVSIATDKGVAYGFRELDSIEGRAKIPRFVTSRDWIPLPVSFTEEHGDTVEVVEKVFSRYMSVVKRWEFTLDVDRDKGSDPWLELADEHPKGEVEVQLQPIAINRQGAAIAAAISYVVRGNGHQSGYIIMLPPPTTVSVDEALCVLLEDLYGIEGRAPDPPWFSEVIAPGEPAATAELESAHGALTAAQERVDAAVAGMEGAVAYKRVLSQKGPALQEVVRATFESMGIKTADSPVSDEFVLVRSGHTVLVEVTGSDGSIATRDLSQLIKDMGKYVEATGEPAKGLFIANPWKDLRPDQRDTKDKPIFPDDVVKTARPFSVALLSTTELFNAYCAAKEAKLTADDVMQRIIDTTGIVALVP